MSHYKKVDLQSIGYQNNYYITDDCIVYDYSTNKPIKIDSKNRIYLKPKGHTQGQYIDLHTLYKKVFNKKFYIDNNINLSGEVWKKIPNHKDYLISNYGRIKSFKRNKVIIMKYQQTQKGYYRIQLDDKYYLLHRLLAIVFKPIENADSMDIHHIDFNSSNNDLDNLQWLTRAEHNKIHRQHKKSK